MRNIRGFEKDKGNIMRDLIGGNITLYAAIEETLGDLRHLTSSIKRSRIGEI